jgi:hypothetical protein
MSTQSVGLVTDRLTGADKRIHEALNVAYKEFEAGGIRVEYRFEPLADSLWRRCCGRLMRRFLVIQTRVDKSRVYLGFKERRTVTGRRSVRICSECGRLKGGENWALPILHTDFPPPARRVALGLSRLSSFIGRLFRYESRFGSDF